MGGIDTLALIILVGAALLFWVVWRWKRGFVSPYLYFSSISPFPKEAGKVRWMSATGYLTWASLILFALAYLDPHILSKDPSSQAAFRQRPTEGAAIYLVLDQSGSMKEQVAIQTPQGVQMISKMELLKSVASKFVEGDSEIGLRGHDEDMLGLVFFARAARVVVPLTLDHRAILRELSTFRNVDNRDQDGTSIGYAIFKTASMIASLKHYTEELNLASSPYTINNSVIILITDGLQDPNPLDQGKRLRNIDVPEAAAYAKEQHVHLYIVNVEPKLATEEFVPYRNIMRRAAESTGGKFYMIGAAGSENLEKIYADIDQLERGPLPASMDDAVLYQRYALYPYLIGVGLACLLASILLDTLLFRRVP